MAKKNCLVFETMNNIQGMTLMENQSNPNEIRLHGVFGVAGVRNNNNRVYSKENYGMMVESLQKVIATEGCLGELEHPNSMNIDLNNVSHKIEDIQMNEDGTVTGTILLLDTDKGKNAKAIVKAGVPLYISSRAAGSIDENGNVTLTTLKTYDLVGTPGFSQAKLNLAENQKFECLNESLGIIYEDDLLDDDDDKKDKDEKSDDSSDSKDKDNNDDNKDNKSDDDNKSEENNDNDDNKNSNDNTTMDDIKQAIDKLTEKVNNLEAELHVAQESLQKPEINYSAVEKWVSEEFAPEFKTGILNEMNESVDSKIDAKVTEATNAINETIENKIAEVNVDEAVEAKITENVKSFVLEEFAPIVQQWVCEEFAPEVQNWVCEEFAPEVQNWITEEFAPEVQNWVTEEFAPEVQNWITEEFAPVVEDWLNEEMLPTNNEVLENKINENVSLFLESQKEERRDATLNSIDAVIESLENKHDAALALLKEEKAADKYAGVYVIEHMPAEYQPLWNTLNEDRQQEIVRQSRAYDFTKEGVLESFWNSVEFKNAQPIQVNENLSPVETKQNAVFAAMMALRH